MANGGGTEPLDNMETPNRQQRRPQIYVRVEFGVSWSPKHAPNHHEITYKSSRRIRERSPYFPRIVPAPNTNFLSSPAAVQPARHQQHQLQQQQQREQIASATSQPQQSQIHQQPGREVRWLEPIEELRPRRSRAESASSHERRRSAPPPLGTNPWDVAVPEPHHSSSFPSSSAAAAINRPAPQVWKDLPEVPSRFRLGEPDMPWTPWTWPMGHEPGAYPQDDDSSTIHSRAASAAAAAVAAAEYEGSLYSSDDLYSASPLPTSIVSPVAPSVSSPVATSRSAPQSAQDDVRSPDDHPERITHLEALSAAMMTVDNGFENQWWYQGPRQAIVNIEPATPRVATTTASHPSLGWAIASSPVRDSPALSFSLNDIVSPVSDYPSTSSPPRFALERSFSTRSEELFLR